MIKTTEKEIPSIVNTYIKIQSATDEINKKTTHSDSVGGINSQWFMSPPCAQ